MEQIVKDSKNINLKESIDKIIIRMFNEIPFLRFKKKKIKLNADYPDFEYLIKDGIQSRSIIVEVKSLGEPRYIRMAIQKLKDYINSEKDTYGVIAAPYISNDSSVICKKNNIGYVDTAGNCFISFGKIFIDKSNYPNPNVEKRNVRSIFSSKSARIVRVMLCSPKKLWQVQELAKEANVSLGLAYKVKERLLDFEYAKEEKKKIYLLHPQEILSKWSNNYSFRKNKLYDCFSLKNVKDIEKALSIYCKKEQIQYALTLFSGAALVAPFARYTRGFAYIDNYIREVVEALDLKIVDSGANFTLMEPYDKGIFYNLSYIDDIKVVNDIQLYLDLFSYKGRGEESAQFLLKQKLEPKW